MQDDHRPPAEGKQALDLSVCASIAIPGTKIRLLNPTKEISGGLEAHFDIPGKIALVRKRALEEIGDRNREVFVQKSLVIGRTETGLLIVVTVSILTDRNRWRGGWFAALVPIGEEKLFSEYLSRARDSVVTELRLERASGGSFS